MLGTQIVGPDMVFSESDNAPHEIGSHNLCHRSDIQLIPHLDPLTRHLPLGRYRATLTEVRDRFVTHPDFVASASRRDVWDGFISYVSAWHAVEDVLAEHLGDKRLLSSVWLAGSFISSKLDPDNLDLTLLVDGELVASCHRKPGISKLRRLLHRDAMLDEFKVSPCIVRYYYFRSPFPSHMTANPEIEDYLRYRGAFDDWWQRARPDHVPKGEPTRETAVARRGYLEVEA